MNEIKIMKYRLFVTDNEEARFKVRFRFLREKDGWKWIEIVDYYTSAERAKKAIDSWKKHGWEVYMDNDIKES